MNLLAQKAKQALDIIQGYHDYNNETIEVELEPWGLTTLPYHGEPDWRMSLAQLKEFKKLADEVVQLAHQANRGDLLPEEDCDGSCTSSLFLPGSRDGDSYVLRHHENWLAVMEHLIVVAQLPVPKRSGLQPAAVDDTDWPNQTEVADKLGTNKTRIGRLIEKRELKTNGKDGRDCRVDPVSILKYCAAEGIAYNPS